MKYLSFIIFIFIYPYALKSQFSICDSLTFQGHYIPFDTSGITTTADFARIYFPKQRRLVSNRMDLERLNLWLNTDSIMLFKDEANEVRIFFSDKPIRLTNIFYPKSEDQAFSTIREYGEGLPFGVTSEDTVVSYVYKIIANGREIPVKSFSDLLNPNRYETILSVKPVEVYKSECGHYLFIYLFGKLNTSIRTMDYAEAAGFSYMAKIIVDAKGYYVDRIVIPGDTLKYFGYGECPYFIGF
jgi:hypothetical protein